MGDDDMNIFRKSLSLSFLFIFGCSSGMSNEEIIAAKKECDVAGLDAQFVINGWNYSVSAIHCMPKEEKR